jgi:hypothetical protein
VALELKGAISLAGGRTAGTISKWCDNNHSFQAECWVVGHRRMAGNMASPPSVWSLQKPTHPVVHPTTCLTFHKPQFVSLVGTCKEPFKGIRMEFVLPLLHNRH